MALVAPPGPWHETKGRELGNWLKNKCPQRQLGGEAKVAGMVKLLNVLVERLGSAEDDAERALTWRHVALELDATRRLGGDFHAMWVDNLLRETPAAPISKTTTEAQTEPPETREASMLTSPTTEVAVAPAASLSLPPLDLSKASVEGPRSKTGREAPAPAAPLRSVCVSSACDDHSSFSE